MNHNKHYGTIAHWFGEMSRGSIICDESSQRIFANRQSLHPDYQEPETGHRVSFQIETENNRAVARDVERVNPGYKNNDSAVITLTDWDWSKNGGYGMDVSNEGQPVFVLGQFLADQTRTPRAGDHLEGTLRRHPNGQWLLVNAVIRSTPESEPEPESIHAALAQKAQGQTVHFFRPEHGPKVEVKIEQPLVAETRYPAPKSAQKNLLPPNQVMSGTITTWDDAKGYGFIRFGDESQNIFFHISAYHYNTSRPQTGQRVSFYCNRPIEGNRQQAVKVVRLGDEAFLFDELPPDYNRLNIDMQALLINSVIAVVFLTVVAVLSNKLFFIYVLISIAAFILYQQDKQTAMESARKIRRKNEYQNRIPENKLHAFSLLGGWPGALVARAAFRHKTKKVPFVQIFWLTVAINVAITYALLIHYTDNPLTNFLKN